MRISIITGLVLLLTATAALPREGAGGKIEWRRDWEKALETARGSSKPIVVYFTHDH